MCVIFMLIIVFVVLFELFGVENIFGVFLVGVFVFFFLLNKEFV